jgi:hypothetical protein
MKRILAGLVIFAGLVLVVVWRFGLGSGAPVASAQVPPPGIPVTAGVVTAQDMPQLLQGIGTVQAFNAVARSTA